MHVCCQCIYPTLVCVCHPYILLLLSRCVLFLLNQLQLHRRSQWIRYFAERRSVRIAESPQKNSSSILSSSDQIRHDCWITTCHCVFMSLVTLVQEQPASLCAQVSLLLAVRHLEHSPLQLGRCWCLWFQLSLDRESLCNKSRFVFGNLGLCCFQEFPS